MNSPRIKDECHSMAQPPKLANRKRAPRILRTLLMIGATLLASCSTSQRQLSQDDTELRDIANQRTISPANLLEQLRHADVVLLGEQHDNPEHHRLQSWIAQELIARGRRIVVAFEMIDDGQAPLLDAFLAKRPRNAAELGGQLDWKRSGWPDWSANYQPIADAALMQPNAPAKPILPANLPLAQARDIARNGLAVAGLDPTLSELLRRAVVNDAAILAAHGDDIRESHCGMLPDSALAPFALAQYARDAVMARAIQAARRESPDAIVLLIAGNGHARKDVGVPLQLARLSPGLRVVSLGLIEGEAAAEGAPFDYAWLTAPLVREDPCEAFRQAVR